MGKPATKLFAEIAELYHNDYEAYEKILMEAMQMAEYSSDIKDSFIKYVSEKQPELATDILHAVKCMENFAVSTKALSHSVYEDLTEETITILKKKVLNHKFFTVRFKSILPYARLGLQIIEKFVEESNNCVDNSKKDTSETSIATNKENTQNKASELYYVEQDKDDFYHWLLKQGIAENTGRMYVRAVEDSEKLALKFGLSSTTLYTNDKNVAIATANALNNSEDFISYNNEKHRRFSAAIKKLLQYYGVTANNKRSRTVHNYVAPPIKSTVVEDISDKISKRYGEVLADEFEDGYCIGDYMHRMRFQSAYEEKYGEELDKDSEELETLLKRIGQVRDDRIFYAATSHNDLLSAIYDDIKQIFDNGATAVYYEYLYEKYESKLLSEMSVYNSDSLKTVMQNDSNFPMGYRTMKSYVTKYGIEPDSNEEIRKVLRNSHVPITFEEIQAEVRHIPMYRIRQALVQIPDAVRVDEGTYFYAPNFYISAEEKIALIRAMRSAIFSKGYIVAKDLREIFRNACPSSAMDSEHFKDYSIREILKVLLREEFEFSSSVITEKGSQLDYGQMFQNYAAEHERLTLNELQNFKKEHGLTVIYWEDIFKEMIRISATELVKKDSVQFNVSAIDDVLEQMYPEEYTALKAIDLFLSFPPVNVRWNGFVLESYLREYSEKFRLIQLSIAQDDYFGVMLRRSSDLQNYNDVAADMLARNESWSDEKSALQLLKDMKFQQRAKNSNISAIIKAAKQKRLNLD